MTVTDYILAYFKGTQYASHVIVKAITMVSSKLRVHITRALRSSKMKTPYFIKGKILKLTVI